ncbi:pentapeptide repeat-containing protein [Myxococcota bacterium]|nr:pentapeptide repeat-containing protein [Myxococcota bacterium]MBU1428991.1 pentapeptide repeat-containing protein [Myxococcota bacterium]MBU1900161.1 pentapeptide repeat-containing protein [Myxococcota bacterium]
MNIALDRLKRLRERIGLFNGFTDGELVTVLKKVTERQILEDGQVIFREGAPGSVMYIIFSGEVRITRRLGLLHEEELALLEMGDCFGEMGLIDASPRSARAIAVGHTVLLGLRESVLKEFDASLAYKLYRNFAAILAARLRGANEHVARLTCSERQLSSRYKTLTGRLNELGGLRAADLSEADLSSSELRRGDFRGACFQGARLRGADLREADLRGADLRESWFVDTNLAGVDFSGADLRGAVFRGTNFEDALTRGAQLQGAKITEEFGETPPDFDADEG